MAEHGHHGHGGQMTPEQQRQMIEQEIRLARNLGQIKHKIVVMSGKGGVGKSTVAANIAETLQALGFKTDYTANLSTTINLNSSNRSQKKDLHPRTSRMMMKNWLSLNQKKRNTHIQCFL